MFIIRKLRMYFILAAILGAVGFGAWKYYEYTQNQIRIFAENAATAELAQRETEAALQKTKQDLELVQEQFVIVTEKFQVAEQRVKTLEEKLSEHDLNYLASRRPKLVEKVIDKATENVLRCLEIASGSPLTEDELNATTRSQINNECPDIANPNYRP